MKRIYTQMGRTGLQQYSGQIYEEWYPPLIGDAGAKIYQMMADNCAIVNATLNAIDKILSRVPYKIVEDSTRRKDIEARDFTKSCFEDMHPGFSEVRSEINGMLTTGWVYLERLYRKRNGMRQTRPQMRSKYNDGLIGWQTWEIRSGLLNWVFDEETGDLMGMVQMPPPDYIPRFVPYSKALLFQVVTTKGNPEGKSPLRGSYRACYNLWNLEDVEGIGAERDLVGLAVLYAPESVVNPKTNDTKGQKSKRLAQQLITGLKRDEAEGVLLPSTVKDGQREWELQLLSSGGSRQFNTNIIINRYQRDIAMTLLASFILLGSQKTGSYSLASTMDDLFRDSLQTILDRTAGVINTNAIPDLIAINPFDDDVGIPHLEFGKVGNVSIKDIGEYVGKLADAKQNLFADDPDLENHLRRLADFPPRPQRPRAMPYSQSNPGKPGDLIDEGQSQGKENDPGVQSQEEVLAAQTGTAIDSGAPVEKQFRRKLGRRIT